MVDFNFKEGGALGVVFTDPEMASLVRSSGKPEAFSLAAKAIVDDTVETFSECCRPGIYLRPAYQAAHAVWASEQLSGSGLSADEVHTLGYVISTGLFGPRNVKNQTYESGVSI